MKDLKIQQEILKALLKKTTCDVHPMQSDDCVYVTTTADRVGYIIPTNRLYVNLATAQQTLPPMYASLDDMRDVVEFGYRLTPTDEYRVGGTVQRFFREDPFARDRKVDIYVEVDSLKNFDFPQLFQVEGDEGSNPIVVTESGVEDYAIVGMVQPYSLDDDF